MASRATKARARRNLIAGTSTVFLSPGRSYRRLGVVLDVPPYFARSLLRVQAGHEVERHVDAGRDAGGGDDLAGIDEACLGSDLDVAAQLAEVVERAPVRRRRATVEQSGVGEGQCAGADAGYQRSGRRQAAQPLADLLVAELGHHSAAARLDEDVEVAVLVPGALGEDAQALGAHDRFARVSNGGDGHLVAGPGPGPDRQHLPGAGEVQLLDGLEQGDGDLLRLRRYQRLQTLPQSSLPTARWRRAVPMP